MPDYDQLIFDEIMHRFDIVQQLGIEDEYKDQSFLEMPLKITRDKGTQYVKALWEASIVRQAKLDKEREEYQCQLEP